MLSKSLFNRCSLFIVISCLLPVLAMSDSRQQLQERIYPPGYHTVTARVEIDANSGVAPHTHPGIEMGYVIQGKAELQVANDPPQVLSAGDSFAISADTVHSIRNIGNVPLTLLSTYVVEVGKPLLMPVSTNAKP